MPSTVVTEGSSPIKYRSTFCYFLGMEHQKNPPMPTDHDLFLTENVDAMDIFTRYKISINLKDQAIRDTTHGILYDLEVTLFRKCTT